MAKKKFYAIARGRKRGILEQWFGEGGAYEQVHGFAGARYKGFFTREEAERWLAGHREPPPKKPARKSSSASRRPVPGSQVNPKEAVIVYTDGGSLNNPGPGGYGVVMLYKGARQEYSGGYRLTTNNRMELTACIVALRELTHDAPVILHSDSKYVVDGISKGWAKRWRSKGWMRTKTEKAKNADLWAELLELCETHDVELRWVKGHAGITENERCDFLVNREQAKQGLPPDTVYEQELSTG